LVYVATYSWKNGSLFQRSLLSTKLMSPPRNAISEPGRSAACTSLVADVRVKRGST
jgi:hypothetical protein